MLILSHIKSIAAGVGFDLCGVTRCQNFEGDKEFLKHWLSEGYGDGLTYLERNIDKRSDASLLVERRLLSARWHTKTDTQRVIPPRLATRLHPTPLLRTTT